MRALLVGSRMSRVARWDRVGHVVLSRGFRNRHVQMAQNADSVGICPLGAITLLMRMRRANEETVSKSQSAGEQSSKARARRNQVAKASR